MPFLGHEEPVTRVRDLADDETFVLSEFEGHASKCSRCVDPLDTFREGRSLCERGLQYATDVANYVFSKEGKAFSSVDQILVRIPRGFKSSRRLLLAIEEGLRLHHDRQPVISYDASYPVGPRRPAEAVTEIIERAPRTRRRVIVYPRSSPNRSSVYEPERSERSERSSPNRGSLYESDRADRQGRRYIRVRR
ncbi:hypothetical protein BGW36DRAFT_392682 [Talaromyces proteolyticus]|uniref:Uncharacterized protein n=1 Tax=Talaromyces proteolyticus TaxID=1131652 RepID=A0AAD4L2X1_9EURO|nr:uncharacterized protein BGW36DRAFT_392682 [Talaromyces proteolyticus]KAH8704948.1 hypothetical protein BGW36DRAFT_392682 [Talaromyces proteolyticus]